MNVMNASPTTVVSPAFPIILLLLGCLPLAFAYKRYLRVTFPQAFGFLIVAVVIGVIITTRRMRMGGASIDVSFGIVVVVIGYFGIGMGVAAELQKRQ